MELVDLFHHGAVSLLLVLEIGYLFRKFLFNFLYLVYLSFLEDLDHMLVDVLKLADGILSLSTK